MNYTPANGGENIRNMTDDKLQARTRSLNEHLEAERRYDIEAIMRTYEQDATVVINGQVFRGADSIRKFHERLGFSEQGGFSELRVTERHRYAREDAIIIEQTLSGKHTGTWQGLAPTGRTFEVPVCTLYLFGPGDKLESERVYFDSLQLLKQLGAT